MKFVGTVKIKTLITLTCLMKDMQKNPTNQSISQLKTPQNSQSLKPFKMKPSPILTSWIKVLNKISQSLADKTRLRLLNKSLTTV